MEFTCTISVKSCNYVIYNWWPHCTCLAGRRIRIKRKLELFRQSFKYIYIYKRGIILCSEYFNTKNTTNGSRIIDRRKYYNSHSLSLSIFLHGGSTSRPALCKRELLSIELESFTWRLTTLRTLIFSKCKKL